MLIFTLSPINHRRRIKQTNKRTKTQTKPALNIHHPTQTQTQTQTQTHHHKHNSITPPRLHIMHPLLLLLTTMPPSSSKYSSSSSSSSYSSPSSSYPAVNSSAASATSSSSSTLCKHSPSATLDILILILVLISGTFLLSSYFAYIFNSLSLLLSSHSSLHVSFSFSFSYLLGFVSVFFLTFIFILFCCGPRSRKCAKPGCKGLKKAMEFDLQLQTEDCIKSNGAKEIDKLPWKGGTEGNPDYECLRAELRKMAPPNGRAVLLFRARCGCPIAKLEGWGPKRGRRHKKALANGGGVNGGGDHR